MTRYNRYIAENDKCLKRAIHYLKLGEFELFIFFIRAAEGFRIKAHNLTIEEGNQNV